MLVAYLVLGVSLILLAVVDALWTTLWVDGGAGPVSSRLTTWLWRALLALVGRRRHRALSLFGPTILMTIVLMWVVLMWAGWVFVFAAQPSSIVSTRDQLPADWSDRIFFVAYTMFTMGNGDFSPDGDVWQVVASVTNGSGMLLVTLTVTYVLSVISAVVAKRSFASSVTDLGLTPETFVRSAWDGRDFRAFDLVLNSLSVELSTLTEQYLAYPILQYYHAARPQKSPIVGLVVLDEALTLLHHGISEKRLLNEVLLRAARSKVAGFLETLESAFIRPASEPPPPPDLSALAESGMPLADETGFRRAVEEERDRRRKLLGMLRTDGWNWSDVSR